MGISRDGGKENGNYYIGETPIIFYIDIYPLW